MLFIPLIPNRGEFFNLSPLQHHHCHSPIHFLLRNCKSSGNDKPQQNHPVLVGALTTLTKSLAGPSIFVINGAVARNKPCWRWADLCRENACTVYTFVYILSTEDEIILHRVHFCAVKAYHCFASKTVDLSFGSDIPQSAYNSVLAYQPSNLPLWGMCQPSKGEEEVCCISMAFISSELLS